MDVDIPFEWDARPTYRLGKLEVIAPSRCSLHALELSKFDHSPWRPGWFVSHQQPLELLCFWLLITTTELAWEILEHRFILCTKCSRLQGSWTGGLCAQQVRSYFYKLQEMIVRNPLSNVYTNGRDANLFVHICCGCLSSGAGKGSKLPHQLAECYVEPWHVWIFLMSRTHISTDICVLAGPSITWFFIDGVDVKLIREPEREDVPLRGKGNPTVSGMPKSSEVPCNCLFYDIPYCRDIRTVPVVVQPLSTAGMHLWWH